MKVILLEDVKDVGFAGETVEVAHGYFRNFLQPRKMALASTPQNIKTMEQRVKRLHRIAAHETHNARALASQIEGVSIKVALKAGEDGKLFGSVTVADIAEKLKESGFEVDKKKISLPETIKRLGMYTVLIKVHPEVEAKLKVLVEKE